MFRSGKPHGIHGGCTLVVPAHQGAVNISQLELHHGIFQGTAERAAGMGIGGVVSMASHLDSDEGADGIVRALHEAGGAHGTIFGIEDTLKESLGILYTTIILFYILFKNLR